MSKTMTTALPKSMQQNQSAALNLHPNTLKFIQAYETEAARKGYIRRHVGEYEILFLENVWGPLFQYNFQGLHLEYPFLDAKGGQRFTDYLYREGIVKVCTEIDGFTTHARNISLYEFEDHLDRQNDLLENGWQLVRLSTNMVKNHPHKCQERIKKAIGCCWARAYGSMGKIEDTIKSQYLKKAIQLAHLHGGSFKIIQFAKEINVTDKTAARWLRQFAEEGYFEVMHSKANKTIGYKIKG